MGDATSEAEALSTRPTLARKRRSSERSREASENATSPASSVSSPAPSAPPSSTSSTSPSPSPTSTKSSSKTSQTTAPPSGRSSSLASTTDPAPSSSSTKPRKRRSSSTKDTNTAPTRDTAGTTGGATGDLQSVLKQAERARSLFDLRRAFYQGDAKEDIPATTLKDFNTAIRTRLGALTCTGGETLASCATRGLGAIKKAFDLQTLLNAIAGPLSPDESTKFAATGLTKYTEATGQAAASKWISQLSALQTKARGGAGKDNRGDGNTDPGVTSGVPSAFETKVPPNITEIKDPGGFDKLILAYVRGEIKALLAEEKTKPAKVTSSRNSKSETSQSNAEKKDAKSRSRSSSPSTKDKGDGRGGTKAAPPVAATTTPADSITGNASSKRRSSRSRSGSNQGGASGVESSKSSASGF